MEVGTMTELALQPGDVVQCVDNVGFEWWSVGDDYKVTPEGCLTDNDGEEFPVGSGCQPSIKFRIIRRANSQPKTWGEMTDADVLGKLEALGNWAALNADPRGLDLFNELANAIKTQPKRETVTLLGYVDRGSFDVASGQLDTHRITFDTIDGKPVCDSIRMEEIK